MELQHLHVFLDDVRGSTILLVPHQLLVGLHYVCQLVSQIILLKGGGGGLSIRKSVSLYPGKWHFLEVEWFDVCVIIIT